MNENVERYIMMRSDARNVFRKKTSYEFVFLDFLLHSMTPLERQKVAFDELIDQRLSQVEYRHRSFSCDRFWSFQGVSNDSRNSSSYSEIDD